LDTKRFLQQQWALVESAPDPVLAEPNHGDRILDTTSRLIAQGGRWRPKADLAQLIDEAALGRRWSRSAGHALALPKGAVRGYRQSATSRPSRRARKSCHGAPTNDRIPARNRGPTLAGPGQNRPLVIRSEFPLLARLG
jgi:hypothetical protein